MNTRITTVFVITGVIAAILLFAVGSVVATYQAWAYGPGGCGGWRHHFYGPYSGGNGGNGPYSGGNGGGNGWY